MDARQQDTRPIETNPQRSSDEHGMLPAVPREDAILEYSPLVRQVVGRISLRLPPHVDRDDLYSVGVMGLMDAVKKYDPEKNCQFKNYAKFRIKGAILDHLRSLDWTPRSVRQKGRRLDDAYTDVEQRLGDSASEQCVADAMGLEIDKFHDLVNQVRGVSMINLEEVRGIRSDGGSAGSFLDIVVNHDSENAFDSLDNLETKNAISDTISSLPEKERLVLSLYYYEDLNMKEIGEILGISESRVCQIHTKSTRRLRTKLKGLLEC